MDDVNHVEAMPLTAVLLLQRAASMATAIQIHHHQATDILWDIVASLKRASWRWEIASTTYTHVAKYMYTNACFGEIG